MATTVKIKVLDNSELRETLDALYDQASQIEMCKYALELCAHITSFVTFDEGTKDVIQEGITINLLWQENKVKMHDVRQVGFKIHAAAKSCDDPAKKTALRVIGQAISTAHMKEHSMVASDYAIKLNNILYDDDFEKATLERLWQIETIKKILDTGNLII